MPHKHLFYPGADSDNVGLLATTINKAYKIASERLLDTLMQKEKLLEHLTALRRYLLLGQGDFIRHLVDLIQ